MPATPSTSCITMSADGGYRQDVDRDAFEIHLDVDQRRTHPDHPRQRSGHDLPKSWRKTWARSPRADRWRSSRSWRKEKTSDVDIIGQFGVGLLFCLHGGTGRGGHLSQIRRGTGPSLGRATPRDGYTIEDCEKEGWGTQITLHLKENSDDENYDEYLAQYEIERLIRKYSDYIRYPIRMEVEEQKRIEEENADDECGTEI